MCIRDRYKSYGSYQKITNLVYLCCRVDVKSQDWGFAAICHRSWQHSSIGLRREPNNWFLHHDLGEAPPDGFNLRQAAVAASRGWGPRYAAANDGKNKFWDRMGSGSANLSSVALSTLLKVLEFFFQIFNACKVIENRLGPGKSLNLCMEDTCIWFYKMSWLNKWLDSVTTIDSFGKFFWLLQFLINAWRY